MTQPDPTCPRGNPTYVHMVPVETIAIDLAHVSRIHRSTTQSWILSPSGCCPDDVTGISCCIFLRDNGNPDILQRKRVGRPFPCSTGTIEYSHWPSPIVSVLGHQYCAVCVFIVPRQNVVCPSPTLTNMHRLGIGILIFSACRTGGGSDFPSVHQDPSLLGSHHQGLWLPGKEFRNFQHVV